MKKYVILSADNNPKYLFFLPLVVGAWRSFGWDSFIFYHGPMTPYIQLIMATLDLFQHKDYRIVMAGLDDIEGFQPSTIAQVSRLYASCRLIPTHYLMTSDADMLPLSDYWKISQHHIYMDRNGTNKQPLAIKPTTWGRDLTDYHYPICYIGMQSSDWYNVMQMTSSDHQAMMTRDMKTIKPRIDVWGLDQDIITKRIMEYGENKFHHVKRGVDHRTGYPVGRVDRSNWHLNHSQFIDAHLPHDVLTNKDSWQNLLTLLHHIWPKHNWLWFVRYTNEFKKLYQAHE